MRAPVNIAPWIIPPLIRRELGVALRQRDIVKGRQRTSWIAAGIAAFFLLMNAIGISFHMERMIHDWLFALGLFVAIPETLRRSAGIFTQERQNDSFGFLFLAGLGAAEIFFSKIAGLFLVAFTDLLALAPFIAVPFLGGGLSFSLFAATVCCLPNVMIFVLALATLGSVLREDESAAMASATAMGAVLCLTTPILYWLKQCFGQRPGASWLVASPAYGPWLIFYGFSKGAAADFWRNAELTMLLSLLIFAVAAVILRRNWRRNPSTAFIQKIRRIWRGARQRRQRRAWLDINPFVWLASLEPGPEMLGWCVLTVIALLWCGGWCLFRERWLTVPVVFLTASALAIFFNILNNYAAGKSMASQRRNCTLETLLTTLLPVEDIVYGQAKALHIQFRTLLAAILSFDTILLVVGLAGRTWNGRAVVVYLLIWTALAGIPIYCYKRAPWESMWVALNCGRAFHPAKRGRLGAWYWIWMMFNMRSLFSGNFFAVGSNNFPSGSVAEFVVAIIVAVLASLITLASYLSNVESSHEKRLLRDLRLIAQEPLPEHNDPRFKVWDISQRFPRPQVERPL